MVYTCPMFNSLYRPSKEVPVNHRRINEWLVTLGLANSIYTPPEYFFNENGWGLSKNCF